MARLSDIATFLRAHRFSYAGVFSNPKGKRAVREHYFQLWLAAELQHRSARRYEIVREEEEYAEKRPDLRAHLTPINPTSIELKIAESWSLPELRSALSAQLVGQYMGEVSSQHGVLVVPRHLRRRLKSEDHKQSRARRSHMSKGPRGSGRPASQPRRRGRR